MQVHRSLENRFSVSLDIRWRLRYRYRGQRRLGKYVLLHRWRGNVSREHIRTEEF
jgi:hypothetical protein